MNPDQLKKLCTIAEELANIYEDQLRSFGTKFCPVKRREDLVAGFRDGAMNMFQQLARRGVLNLVALEVQS